MSIKFTTLPAKFLYQPLLSTDVTFKLADITGFNGNNLTAADFGTVGYGVLLNSDRSVMELFSWDPATIASTSISFVDRGLPFDGDDTPVTAYKLDWPAGSTVLLGSDTPQFIQWLKDYIDAIAIAGSPDASTTVKGIVQEATQAQRDAGTGVGSTSARLFSNPSTERGKLINDYAVDASGTDSYAITITPAITAYTAGQRFTFKAGTANTGACTLNVSGLGAKTIKKDVSSDLATGDILANQIVEVEYDGTNMQLLSRSALGSVQPTVQTFTGNGTYTPAAGIKYAVVEVQAGGGGGNSSSSYGGGGGGGGYAKKIVSSATIGASQTITVGAGGAPGSDGGNSSFGAIVTATGGTHGVDGAIGGDGGSGASGDINIVGSDGAGFTAQGGSGSTLFGGQGGNSFLGGGGRGGNKPAFDASNGNNYGGGGGGGTFSNNTSTGSPGASGADGIVIVTEFY